MRMRKGQIGMIAGVFFLMLTFVLLALAWPVIDSAITVAGTAAGADAETILIFKLFPFFIVVAALIGMFYFNNNTDKISGAGNRWLGR
jgi:hypothetical protein